jgi:hypothetical protein
MLDAWVPKTGTVLNVGSLPPDQKSEINAFLASSVIVSDLDIDADRHPTFLADVTEAPEALDCYFDAILLFGLPYFAAPSRAIAATYRLAKPGGIGLFGFAADTNPTRGSLWHPRDRHLWRQQREPLGNLGLKGNLWAFDDEGLPELFKSWDEVQFEFMNHYWFAVAHKHG